MIFLPVVSPLERTLCFPSYKDIRILLMDFFEGNNVFAKLEEQQIHSCQKSSKDEIIALLFPVIDFDHFSIALHSLIAEIT